MLALFCVHRWSFLFIIVALFVTLLACQGPIGSKACLRDEQCALGLFCDLDSKRCKRGCNDDDRCEKGKSCFLQKCEPKICKPNARAECLPKETGVPDKGLCQQGHKICIANGQRWSLCHEQVKPRPELCDNRDNDCNGKVDEGLQCDCFPIASFRSCYSGSRDSLGQGTCKKGVQYCSSKLRWGACLGQITPQKEMCNRLDDDCDGKIDNGSVLAEDLDCKCDKIGLTRECRGLPNKKSCPRGSQECKFIGKVLRWGLCEADLKSLTPVEPEENHPNNGCNGKDDDCDGYVDNHSGKADLALQKPCYPGFQGCSATKISAHQYKCIGECSTGFQICESGKWGKCEGMLIPQKEICNGKDDDCNGKSDEGGICP